MCWKGLFHQCLDEEIDVLLPFINRAFVCVCLYDQAFQAFNVWGVAVAPDLSVKNYKSILLQRKKVSLEEAIFRSEKAFQPSNLKEHHTFWEEEILHTTLKKKFFLVG